MIDPFSSTLRLARAWIENYGNPEAQRRRRFKRYAKKMDGLYSKFQDALDEEDAKALRLAIDNLLNRRV